MSVSLPLVKSYLLQHDAECVWKKLPFLFLCYNPFIIFADRKSVIPDRQPAVQLFFKSPRSRAPLSEGHSFFYTNISLTNIMAYDNFVTIGNIPLPEKQLHTSRSHNDFHRDKSFLDLTLMEERLWESKMM